MQTADKSSLRRMVRDAFPGAEGRAIQSRALCDHVTAWLPYRKAQVIAAYVPLPREADITPLLSDILGGGRTLALPRCGEHGAMTLRRVTSMDELIPNRWGIPEPAEAAEIIHPDGIDLILVPLEAIDPAGMRLGKGGGYYDRLLSGTCALTLGAALMHQRVGYVPHESHDAPLHAVADAAGVHLFK